MEKADSALKSTQLVKENAISVTKVGAIAGFGAMVINIGLLPALAVYQDNHPDILLALERVSGETFRDSLNAATSLTRKRTQTERFVNASVALKMMARTYKINK